MIERKWMKEFKKCNENIKNKSSRPIKLKLDRKIDRYIYNWMGLKI